MPPTAQQLRDQLHHLDGEMSWAAARELARLGERRAIEPLPAMLDACLTANELNQRQQPRTGVGGEWHQAGGLSRATCVSAATGNPCAL